MTTKTWTVKEMVATGACYPRERIKALWADRQQLSLMDIFTLDIPISDKLWVCHLPGAVPELVYKRWQKIVLGRIITKYALTCGVPVVEQWAKNWLSGTDCTKISAARAARAAEAAWTAWAAEAARAARAAEYQQQLTDLLALIGPRKKS